jgi:predicted outer membrane repeat protein
VKDQSGGPAHHSLQQAVDAAAPNAVLLVKGVCTGSTIIDTSLTIAGAGNGVFGTVLDGEGVGTVVQVGLEPPTPIDVAITGLTITHGSAAHGAGGIVNFGSLTLSKVVVTGNAGGGILNEGFGLSLVGSSVAENTTTARGGGIVNRSSLTLTNSSVATNAAMDGAGIWSDGYVTLTDSLVSGNIAQGDGGGVFNLGTLDADGSTVSGNRSGGRGGGIDSHGTVSLDGLTISNNTAGLGGGGIFNSFAGSGFLSASAVIGNTALDGVGLGSNVGGGIADCSSQLTLGGSSTIVGNRPDDFGTGYC